MVYFVLIIVISALITFFIRQLLRKNFRNKQANRFEKSARPSQAPLEQSKAKLSKIRKTLFAAALPYTALKIGNSPAETPTQSRLGGPVYLPHNMGWPTGTRGKKLLFIAQINFEEIPPMPDFPQTGILQFFVANDDLFGADFDNPEKSQVKFIFHKRFPSELTLHQNLPDPSAETEDEAETYSPFQKIDVHTNGRALFFDTNIKDMSPDLTHWQFSDIANSLRETNEDILEALWDELELARPDHYLGGHICLTQRDFRYKDNYSDYDRILLQLGSDDNIMWGDMGEMSISMRKEDLAAKQFDKAIFWWDCC